MKTHSIATDKDRDIIRHISANYQTLKDGFNNEPTNKEKLKHLPYHTIIYYFNKFNKEKNNKFNNNKRIEQSLILREPTEIELSNKQEKLDTNKKDLLNFCPECGCCLVNIKNALMLQAEGRIKKRKKLAA